VTIKYDLSIVVPLYNEEPNVARCAAELQRVLDPSGLNYELILVDNGSRDGTAREIRRLCEKDSKIMLQTVPMNVGYGNGVISGLNAARGDVVGWVDGDCQVDPDCIITLYSTLKSKGGDMAVAIRSKRADGLQRAIMSKGYNTLVFLLFGIKVPDVDAKPKLLTKETLQLLAPKSKDWFIDTELLLGARRKGLNVCNCPVDSGLRQHGQSKVKKSTVLEFAINLMRYRLGLNA
jgi:glycosyltransferase involved in cell wall biosynthesis